VSPKLSSDERACAGDGGLNGTATRSMDGTVEVGGAGA
jgi:hypothetical protein